MNDINFFNSSLKENKSRFSTILLTDLTDSKTSFTSSKVLLDNSSNQLLSLSFGNNSAKTHLISITTQMNDQYIKQTIAIFH